MSPDASRDSTNDQKLDAEQLGTKYDGLAKDGKWGEHPKHPMEEWRAEVHRKKTRIGYWNWVALKLADDKNDLAEAEEEEITELQAADTGNQGA
jgi:hypothetical protein